MLDSLGFAGGWTRFLYNPDLQATVTRFSPNDSVSRRIAETHRGGSIRSPGLNMMYQYDLLGRITTAVDSSDMRTQWFSYNGLSRLDTTRYGWSYGCTWDSQKGYKCLLGGQDSTHAFHFDPLGNRDTTVGPSGTTTGTYAAGNRIQTFAGCSYATDPGGNVDSLYNCAESARYTWTPQGRLATATVGGNTVGFFYDAHGRLVRRELNGVHASYFLWDGDNLVAELDTSGSSAVAEYSYYPGGLDNLHAIRRGSVYYAHTDEMGNVRALANWSGEVERTYNYDEWGRLLPTSGDSLPFNNADRARWKGALWMGPELDLYYMRNRWYEPRTGRFLSEDPIGLEGGINQYAFGGGDPVNRADPSGLMMDRPANTGGHLCWSDLCQAAWNGGGAGDWNGDGVYDFSEFADYGYAVVVVAAALRRLGITNVTPGQVVRRILWEARVADWGACCQDQIPRVVAQLVGRGGMVPGRPRSSRWGEFDGTRIVLSYHFWDRAWAKKYNDDEFRDTLFHELYHYFARLVNFPDPRYRDARAECFAVNMTGYISPFYWEGTPIAWIRQCAR